MFHKLVQFSRYSYAIRSPSVNLVFNNNNNNGKNSVFSSSNYIYYYQQSSPLSSKEQVTESQQERDLCKPVTRTRTCVPSPRLNVSTKCRNKMLPPACPWDEKKQNAENKKMMKRLLLGLLATAVSVAAAALWYNQNLKGKPKDAMKTERLYKRPKPTCRIPNSSDQLPDHVPYLLIGGGTASFSAFRAIKSSDPSAKVLVISNECHFPYMRPPLSKEMWYTKAENIEKLMFKQWNGTERSLFYEPDDFYLKAQELETSANGGVAVAQGYTVTRIDCANRVAYLDGGKQISYDKCLVATGARPRNLDVFQSASKEIQDKVSLYRDTFDFKELNEICSKEAKAIAIIGGGFLGSELSCSLGGGKSKIKVYQLFRESGNMGKVLPEYLSFWTSDEVRRQGVTVIPKVSVEDVTYTQPDKRLLLHLDNGEQLTVDHVVVACGVLPNTDLAKTSHLEIDPELGGFLVNAEMEARSDLYIAGDCSCFYDIKLGRRRVEHHDHAVVSGRLAGENMTGAKKPYVHQSMFWSDLGPHLGYEAIGLVDSTLPTVGVFAKRNKCIPPPPPAAAATTTKQIDIIKDDNQSENACNNDKSVDNYEKGIIFYLRNGIVVGIVLWNVFNRMSIARQVLKDEKKYDDLNEVAKLFNIHQDD